jgi:hypothetical protein
VGLLLKQTIFHAISVFHCGFVSFFVYPYLKDILAGRVYHAEAKEHQGRQESASSGSVVHQPEPGTS